MNKNPIINKNDNFFTDIKKTITTANYSYKNEDDFLGHEDRKKLIKKINFLLSYSHKDEIDRLKYILSKMEKDDLCMKYNKNIKLWNWKDNLYQAPINDLENIIHKIVFWAVEYKRK